jgi:hypothetical protein
METREGIAGQKISLVDGKKLALWTEKSPASEIKLALWAVNNLTSALDCAAKSMAMVSFALTFYRVGVAKCFSPLARRADCNRRCNAFA